MKNCKTIQKRIFIGYLFIFLFLNTYTQSIILDKSFNNLSFEEFAYKIEEQCDCKVYFLFDSIEISHIQNIDEDISAQEFFKKYGINFSLDGNRNIFLSNQKIYTAFPEIFFGFKEQLLYNQS